MNLSNDQMGIKGKSARRQRACLGCLGHGAIGLLAILTGLMVAGAG